ncbi:MAG: hypothetical protein V1720_06220 [bacterium]
MKTIILFLTIAVNLFAQEYIVEKINGDIKYMRGAKEELLTVRTGDKLLGSDLIITGEQSYIQLNRDGNRFILQSNSALGLNHIKKVTLNELLLAFAMEEIRNVPKSTNDGKVKNTAVYGTESKTTNSVVAANQLGVKKLNGAKQLAESGYKESAVIVAKETFRLYPDTKKNIPYRIFFADLLIELGLNEEAMTELNSIKQLDLTGNERESVEQKISGLKQKMVGKE